MNIHVHIERLVLHSDALNRGDAALLKAAVEAHLHELIARDGVPPAWHDAGHAWRMRGGAVRFSPGDDAGAWGAHIAHAVHGTRR